MGWAANHIAQLCKGNTVAFRPRDPSMVGRIPAGQKCTIAPVDPAALEIGDIVLCRVKGAEFLHVVKGIDGDLFQIADCKGGVKGWSTGDDIFGRCIKMEA